MVEDFIECTFCERYNSRYIKLLNTYICEKCEREITNISCEDIRYEYYNIVMKKVWSEYLINF